MRVPFLALATAGALIAAGHPAGIAIAPQDVASQPITWADTAKVRPVLEAQGLTPASFDAHVAGLREAHTARVRDGDLDHLVFYLLQSTQFTALPPIEPALSAKAFVEALPERQRASFLDGSALEVAPVPAAVRSRRAALLKALATPKDDARLVYFAELAAATFPDPARRAAGLDREYLRVIRFVYEKEFVAQRAAKPAEAVAALYRSRGLSTDTAVEAGYVLSIGLGIVKSLEPERRVRRVLIVGPGLDLAPRTALSEIGPPASYQPWAVIDGLAANGLARLGDLEVVGADINPRVVSHLRRVRTAPPTLELTSEIRDSDTVSLSTDYRAYFAALGTVIADGPTPMRVVDGHLRKRLKVGTAAAAALSAARLDIVTERLQGRPFDLIVATNILPYFDDGELALALTNIAGMLAPGGTFLHNEARPALQQLSVALEMPFVQSRHAVIATVRGAPAPLFDSVWIHRKTAVAAGR